mgnify:CR=1 FL=1
MNGNDGAIGKGNEDEADLADEQEALMAHAADLMEEARWNAAEEAEYVADNPELKERLAEARRRRRERRVVGLGPWHYAEFRRSEDRILVFCDGAEPKELKFFEFEGVLEEKLIEKLWTMINFG